MVGGAAAAILTAGWMSAPQPLDAATEPVAGPQGDDPDAATDQQVTTVDGPVVSNMRGDYQARLHVQAGTVVAVDFPIAGTDAAQSRHINNTALPVLEERILEAQSWDVEYVSGASYTSPALVESAREAFDQAGLSS